MVDSFLERHCLTPTMVEKRGLEQVHFDLTTPWRWGSPRIWSYITLTGPICAKDGSPLGQQVY